MKQSLGMLVLCAAALLAVDNPFVGTWKLNVAESKITPGPLPRSETVTFGADNKVEVSTVYDNGQAVTWSYTFSKDPATITGLPDASVIEACKGNTMDDTWTFGKDIQKGHGVISKDGKTMIYTFTGTFDDGKETCGRLIYQKQ